MNTTREKSIFRVGDEYQLGRMVGEGAYGVVCSARHVPTDTKVAIKKVSPLGHAMFALRTLREIKILRFFRHENIVGILDFVKPESFDKFNDVYIVQELMETDLHRVIRSQELSDDHCQYFIYQILRALKCLHSADILHRDLKPSNLLLNSNCDLKICDFGLARTINVDPITMQAGFMTEYVATRWYRAPEIMLSFKEYDKAIDMWSVGCILSEIITGRPLFPGRDYHHQLSLILEVNGTPCAEDFNNIKSHRARNYIRGMPLRSPTPLETLHPRGTLAAIDLLRRLLAFNPDKRITVDQALAHPYMQNYHDINDEPISPSIPDSVFSFDALPHVPSIEELKVLLWNEIWTTDAQYANILQLPPPSSPTTLVPNSPQNSLSQGFEAGHRSPNPQQQQQQHQNHQNHHHHQQEQQQQQIHNQNHHYQQQQQKATAAPEAAQNSFNAA